MKIILAILGIGFIGFLILAFLFVRWANQPEQVAEFKRMREAEATKKAEDEKKRAAMEKEVAAKRANLKLVIDENFANNRFEFLDYKFDQSSQFKFKDNQFHYSVFSIRNSNPTNYFIFSKEDFTDFAAEMDFDIHGYYSRAGIFWDAEPSGDREPIAYQTAYSSASGLDVEAGGDDSDSFNLGSFTESVTTQKLRVERLGKSLKVSVNGKVLFDKIIENTGQGKVGIFLRNRGGSKDSSDSITVDIKSFKVWR